MMFCLRFFVLGVGISNVALATFFVELVSFAAVLVEGVVATCLQILLKIVKFELSINYKLLKFIFGVS